MRNAGFAVPVANSLATRLCHDLAGPLVAVLASLELAAEASPRGGGDDDPLSVAADSARHLSARLALLRAAWGMEPGPLDGGTIAALAEGLANRARLTLELDGLGTEPLPGPEARVVLNMLLLAAASLPKGGVIALARDGAGIAARIAGPQAAWPADLAAVLHAPDAAEPTPRTVLPIMLGMLARQAGARLSLPPPDGPVGGTVGAGAAPLLLSPA